MSTGTKFAWGCGVLLLILLGAGGGGFCYLVTEHGLTQDAGEISRRAEEILPLELPAGLRPNFSMYLEKDRRNPMVYFAGTERTAPTTLMLAATAERLTMAETFNRLHNAHPGIRRVGLEELEDSELVELQFLGETVPARMIEEQDEQGATLRALLVTVDYGGRQVMMSLRGDPERVGPGLLQSLLDSVQRRARAD